jgi:hypothetical protein
MIEILEGNDFINDYGFQAEITKIIKSKLEQAENENTFIITKGVRNIGKTYALMEYAYEQGYYVVVSTNNLANLLKEKYPYNEIVSQHSTDKEIIRAVCDENVDIDLCKKNNINVLTGYLNNYDSNKNSENFEDDIVNVLKNELKCLNSKITKSRENEEFGIYKNLILAYKEVLTLYKEMTEIKNKNMTICNFDNTFKVDKDFNIETFVSKIMSGLNDELNKLHSRGI